MIGFSTSSIYKIFSSKLILIFLKKSVSYRSFKIWLSLILLIFSLMLTPENSSIVSFEILSLPVILNFFNISAFNGLIFIK